MAGYNFIGGGGGVYYIRKNFEFLNYAAFMHLFLARTDLILHYF